MADNNNQDKSSTTGFCYPTRDPNNMQTHLLNQIQNFHESAPSDQNQIFNHHQSFFNKHDPHHNIMEAAAPDYDLMRCVFSCEGNERPSQGLSLSLSSSNPSTIGLQSFELRNQHDFRDGYYGKSVNMVQNQGQFHLRNSKFLGPAQELLNEFCFLGNKENDNPPIIVRKQRENHEQGSSSNASKNTLELIELQKRKANLLEMLEEVDRRYKHYCNQMKGVVSSFEAMAGNGAAKVYSTLASKAMSRHFRCLRDGLVTQIEDTKKAMGGNDHSPIAPGTTKGETPRLKLLDQTLRQQKSLQQMNLMESHPWRPQRGLPERSVSVLRAWLFEHFLHPYPSDVDKHILARQTGLSRSQVSNWFINARVRLWKPMVEEMYLEETKDSLDNTNTIASSSDQVQNPNFSRAEDRKPTPNDLIRIDSDCLSSIISPNNDPKHDNQINFGYGSSMDFSAYNQNNHNAATYGGNNESGPHNFIGGSGVSLTLGLQQHGESSMGLGFSSPPQNSLFFSREDQIIGDCDQAAAQYNSILDGDQGHNLTYRNLLGAQLLHDLGS